MTKSEFLDWQSHPTTKEIFVQLVDSISEKRDLISRSAGIDPSLDRYRAGYVDGMETLLKIDFEEEISEDA